MINEEDLLDENVSELVRKVNEAFIADAKAYFENREDEFWINGAGIRGGNVECANRMRASSLKELEAIGE